MVVIYLIYISNFNDSSNEETEYIKRSSVKLGQLHARPKGKVKVLLWTVITNVQTLALISGLPLNKDLVSEFHFDGNLVWKKFWFWIIIMLLWNEWIFVVCISWRRMRGCTLWNSMLSYFLHGILLLLISKILFLLRNLGKELVVFLYLSSRPDSTEWLPWYVICGCNTSKFVIMNSTLSFKKHHSSKLCGVKVFVKFLYSTVFFSLLGIFCLYIFRSLLRFQYCFQR